MAIQVQNRRGTAAANAAFIGAVGELIWLIDEKRWVGHDGSTAGGVKMARLDEVSEDTYREVGNANVTIQVTDGRVALNASLTAPRTATLPAANAVPAGKTFRIGDKFGGINGANVLNLTPAGSDTINGTGVAFPLATPRGGWEVTSDGDAKWMVKLTAASTVVVAPISGLSATTAQGALEALAARGLGPRHLSGLGLANNASDATNDIDVAPGAARDDADTGDLVLAATVVKQIDVAFAEYVAPGTPSGGRDSTDNLTGAKWFDVYVIGGAGKNAQPFYTTSATPTLPSGFTRKRFIGSVLWMGSFLKGFVQFGSRFLFLAPPALDIDATIGASATNYTLAVPRNRRVTALLNLYVFNGSSAAVVYARAPDQADDGPSQTATPMPSMAASTGAIASGQVQVLTNTSGQVTLRAQNASTLVRASTIGWIDQLQ
jgi:hypothetical protein